MRQGIDGNAGILQGTDTYVDSGHPANGKRYTHNRTYRNKWRAGCQKNKKGGNKINGAEKQDWSCKKVFGG